MKMKVNDGKPRQLENLRSGNIKRNMRSIIYNIIYIYIGTDIFYYIYVWLYLKLILVARKNFLSRKT